MNKRIAIVAAALVPVASLQAQAGFPSPGFAGEPHNKTDLALAYERGQASGVGLFFPVTNRALTVWGGTVDRTAAATNGFGAGFLDGLAATNFGGVEIFPVTLRTDDASGVIGFHDAGGSPFDALPPLSGAGYAPDWIAELHGVPDAPTNGLSQSALDFTRLLLLPSHVEMEWHFVDATNLGAYAEARRSFWNPPGGGGTGGTNGLRFTGIRVDSNAVQIALAWPENHPLPGSRLDILCAPRLDATNAAGGVAWHPLAQIPVEPSGGSASNSIPLNLLPPAQQADPDGPAVTNTADSLYVSGVAYTNVAAPFDAEASASAFFRAASLVDADGDGLSDALETWVHLTDPDDDDTDDDGRHDGAEIALGLDPLDGSDGPDADPDGDGLPNALEAALGTDPRDGDSDGDGLTDGEEYGPPSVAATAFRWFDASGGTDLTARFASNMDNGCAEGALPFPLFFGGRALTSLSANANGIAGFFPGAGTIGAGRYANGDMGRAHMPSGCGLLAAGFWDDLCLYPALGPAVTLADVATNGHRHCVVEYKNAGFYSGGATTNNLVSFQLVFEEGVSNRFRVFYRDANGRGDGRSATLGARTVPQSLQFSCDTASVADGLALEYRFGIGTGPLDPDTDDDGLDDGAELALGTDPFGYDTDGDGLRDGEEAEAGTDPLDPDTDGDGLGDYWEFWNMPEFDPLDPSDGLSDCDGDGLSFAEEYLGTRGHASNPNDWDTDGDGLSDGAEAALGTDPYHRDSDRDGLDDHDEIPAGTNPLKADTDNDGMPDGWEAAHGFDPSDPSDGPADADGDGLSNKNERYKGTDPRDPDTDGDGRTDGAEVGGSPTSDPLDPDTDGDGLNDGEEIARGTNPRKQDTDGDGMKDGWEDVHGFDPLDAADPDPGADPDGDHIPNLREAALGTSPHLADTDGDGLGDHGEAGWIGAGLPPLAVPGGTNVLALMGDPDSGQAVLPLPFPVEIQGSACSNVCVGIDGFVELGRSAAGGRLSDSVLRLDAFRDNLKAYPAGLGSSVTLADIATNGARYCVVEYKNMGFHSGGATTNHLVSFQVVFQEGVPDRADVVFPAAAGRGDGRNARLEARAPYTTLAYSRHQPAVSPGLSIAYHFGTGTDPLRADSDADGIGDADEIAAGLDPLASDTDGDGLSDAFELASGMSPFVHNDTDGIAGNGADEDPDGDGLANSEEYLNGTDPFNPDSDGDGVPDGDEIGQGSDPLDDLDSQPREVVPFTILFGDESGSHSEKYRLTVTPVSGDTRPGWTLVNRAFGQPDPLTVRLAAGATYEVALGHAATDPDYDGAPRPDYDYTLEFSPDASAPGMAVLADDPDGILGFHDESDTFYAAGKTARLTVVRAGLVPDYNRDRTISSAEASGATFRLWLNDDADEGDVAEGGSDLPGQFSGWLAKANFGDRRVNGRADLPDFFPVWLDIGEALAHLDATPGGEIEVRLSQKNTALAYVPTALSTNDAGAFLVSDVAGLASAATRKITNAGVAIPGSFVDAVRADPSKGVILVEGRAATSEPLVAEIWRNGRKIVRMELPLRVTPVEQMYTRVNLRNGAAVVTPGSVFLPASGKNVVFVHGFNVTEDEARGWHSEMFKRLWQSGSNARFHAVTWKGDIGWPNALHYHEDVASAFQTAPHLKNYVNGLSGGKIMMAQSLGNLVVSSAIADHGMGVDKFFMFHAAVAAEAFDMSQWNTDAMYQVMVPGEWYPYPSSSWSAKWHGHFLFAGHPNDDRGYLTWKNRLLSVSSATTLYNYYSSGDEVLELFSEAPDNNEGMVPSDTLTWGRYAWHKQETHKGCGALDPSGTSWAGWGFADPPRMRVFSGTGPTGNILYDYVPNTATNKAAMLAYLAGDPILPLDFFEENVIFKDNPPEIFLPEIPADTRNEILAKGIPALSGPTGRQSVGIRDGAGNLLPGRNIDMNEVERPNGWGRTNQHFVQRWLHGDLKAMAFFYNFKLYEDVVSKGGLK
ncbi:MAG: hypothetical protein ACOX5G_04910 [Kiritimatiellia bacterium]